jgi:hypothetical protein
LIRPLLQEVLGHVVHARMDMQALKLAIIDEMQSGYRPTYRGHAWGREQFEDLEAAGHVLEAVFHLLKGVQFPEMRSTRWVDALEEAEHARQGTERSDSSTNSPTPSVGELPAGNHVQLDVVDIGL